MRLQAAGRIAVGVDGGGSHTRVLVQRGEGTAFRGTGPASNPGVVGVDAARAAIEDAIRMACDAGGLASEDLHAIALGIAGLGYEDAPGPSRAALAAELEGLFPGVLLDIHNDVEIAHIGAFDGGPGILLISGTGAVALARDAGGRVAHAGGYGRSLEDAGSGFDLLRRVAIRFLEAEDEGCKSVRKDAAPLLASLELERISQLVAVFARGITADELKRGIAAILDAEAGGAEWAQLAITESARALRRHLDRVEKKLAVSSLPVACVGGLYDASTALQAALRQEIGEGRLVSPKHSAVEGALSLAQAHCA